MEKQEYQLQNEVQELVKGFMTTTMDVRKVPCADLILELIGGKDAWKAQDELHYMKVAMLELLGFLAKPEVSKKFNQAGSSCRGDVGEYIVRIITCLDLANNEYAFAEMLNAEMNICQLDKAILQRAKSEYSKQLN